MPKADVGPYKKTRMTDFEKLELLAGRIAHIEKHPKLPTHYVITIDCPAQDEDYQIVADLVNSYTMPQLLGKQVVIIGNVPSESIGGIDSQAALLICNQGKKKVLVTLDKIVPPGIKIHALHGREYTFFE